MPRPWTLLRTLVIAGAVVGLLFWIGTFVRWWRIPDAARDGVELLGLLLATAYLIGLVLPPLVLGLMGRWLVVAALFAGAAVVLASDTLWPWLPWHWLPGPPRSQ